MARAPRAVLFACTLVMAASGAGRTAPVAAQASAAPAAPHSNVISANPFGLLVDFFNAEYERAIGTGSTAGFGGSFFPGWEADQGDYVNFDVFWRLYPSDRPFDGWALGVKAGYTTDLGAGIGFDVNRSWLVGSRDNIYIGLGFGLKRILGTSGDDIEFVPTVRLVNVGVAF